jgi:hypothetical protein
MCKISISVKHLSEFSVVWLVKQHLTYRVSRLDVTRFLDGWQFVLPVGLLVGVLLLKKLATSIEINPF